MTNSTTKNVQVTAPEEIAICTQASIAMNTFIRSDNKSFDFEKLKSVTKVDTRNFNKIIDKNHYFLPETKYSSAQHRTIGIGVQALTDVFILLRKSSLVKKQLC